MNKRRRTTRMIKMRGIGVSPGIAVGLAYIVDRDRIRAPRRKLRVREIDSEVARFEAAVNASEEQLLEIMKDFSGKSPGDPFYIIESHLLMMRDPLFHKQATQHIQDKRVNAEWAIERVFDDLKKAFEGIEDEYLRARSAEVDYIRNRILRNLVKAGTDGLDHIDEPSIVVAHDLSPGDTARMDKAIVKGFLTDIGGTTSHTAIIARALEIPAVVGLEVITEAVCQGDVVILDGEQGEVIIHPTARVEKEYRCRWVQQEKAERDLFKTRDLPAETLDGFRMKLKANIEAVEEARSATRYGAEGVGLYRTEFLYLNRQDLPEEEEQYLHYRKAVEEMAPWPTTIRTLDLGGDKFDHKLSAASNINSAMGLRAIRFCLKEIEIFKTQLRAILRASAHGEVQILLPLISNVQEIEEAKAILEDVKSELSSEGLSFDERLRLGIMIEVPSSTVIADLLATKVDFFSIGTNDLIQYQLAIDRGDEHVAYLYNPLHPSVLRTIKHVVDTGHEAGIPVGMCGEMAGVPLYLPILLGLGLDQLSMNPHSIPHVKRIIRASRQEDAKRLVEEILPLRSTKEIEMYFNRVFKGRFKGSSHVRTRQSEIEPSPVHRR